MKTKHLTFCTTKLTDSELAAGWVMCPDGTCHPRGLVPGSPHAHRNIPGAETYAIGETVEVHSFGRWYRGTVLQIGRTRVLVRYTAGRGATRDKWFTPELVQAAAS